MLLHTMCRSFLPSTLLSFLLLTIFDSTLTSAEVRLLIFTKTSGFHHDSIPEAVAALNELATLRNWTITLITNSSSEAFAPAALADANVIAFTLTTGDVFDNATQRDAFKAFVNGGGGWVGIHSASDTEYNWPWYGQLVGAYFANHPSVQTASLTRVDANHPSTVNYPEQFSRQDEWYNFNTNPRDNGVHVLLNLEESSYSGGTMGSDHPIAWCKNYDGGRSWYTAGGHTPASYSEAGFRLHLAGGVEWAAKVANGSCEASGPAGDGSGDGSGDGGDADGADGDGAASNVVAFWWELLDRSRLCA